MKKSIYQRKYETQNFLYRILHSHNDQLTLELKTQERMNFLNIFKQVELIIKQILPQMKRFIKLRVYQRV